MPKIALTDAYLRKLKPQDKAITVSDATTTGLRARISAHGKISFALQARDHTGKLQTVTLGRYPDMSLKEARIAADKTRLDLKSGTDVNAEKRKLRSPSRANTDDPTLSALLREYESEFGARKKVWARAGPKTNRTQAGRVVELVFLPLLDKPVTKLKEEDFAACVNNYKPVRIREKRTTANGQASKARAYLSPVLDWAAGRKSHAKLGAGREPKLDVVGLENVHDPAVNDPKITGRRDRVLTQDELERLLPLLKYPAPKMGRLQIEGKKDFRPIAMRFMLYTAARREEVVTMQWRDLDRINSVWRKPSVKSTKGKPRGQDLPMSEAAMNILRSLPSWGDAKPEDLVFPNATGSGKLGNWPRIQAALYEASGTRGWNRHDLRRTSATLLNELGVALSDIEKILAHTDPLRAENVGGAASHYIHIAKIMKEKRDPQEEALSLLAEAFERIEAGSQ